MHLAKSQAVLFKPHFPFARNLEVDHPIHLFLCLALGWAGAFYADR